MGQTNHTIHFTTSGGYVVSEYFLGLTDRTTCRPTRGVEPWTPTWRPRCTAFAGRTIRQARKVFTAKSVSLVTLQQRLFFIYTAAETVSLIALQQRDCFFIHTTTESTVFLYLHYSRDRSFIYTTAENVSIQRRLFLFL